MIIHDNKKNSTKTKHIEHIEILYIGKGAFLILMVYN